MKKSSALGPVALFLGLLTALPAAMAANVAMLGTASQSSNLSGFAFPGDAQLAIDGNRDGNYFNHSVTITNNTDPSPSNDGLFDFWQLQLDQRYTVSNLLLFGRTDCCKDRIDPFRLELFDGGTTVFSQDVTTFQEDILATVPKNIRGMVFNFNNLEADRVKITLLSRNFLEIAEVEINGTVPTTVPLPPALPLLGGALLGLGCLRRRRRG